MKKIIKYENIQFKYVKIKYKHSNKTHIIKGKCFDNPLKPLIKGSGCIIIHDIGIIIDEIHGTKGEEYYYTNYIPLYKIDEIHVLEKDKVSSLYLAWIGKYKNLPFDTLFHINSFIKDWINEIKVYDLIEYK